MVNKRPCTWKSGEETVCLISGALAPSCPKLFMQNELYTSEDMKAGIDAQMLASWADPLLKDLLVLDPRGGMYAQGDVEKALGLQAQIDENKPHVETMALQKKLSVHGLI